MNHRLLSVALFSVLSAAVALPARSQCIPRDEKVETQVETLLSKMTLRDKVGQMCELAIDKVLSPEAVDEAFGKYRVGSILNVPFGVAQTPEKWADIIRNLNEGGTVSAFPPSIKSFLFSNGFIFTLLPGIILAHTHQKILVFRAFLLHILSEQAGIAAMRGKHTIMAWNCQGR